MKFSHTLKTSASPEIIWSIWTDVENWSRWDTELLDSRLEDPFGLGAVGQLTPKSGRVSTFRISQLNLGKSYTFTIRLPFCSLNVHRYLSSHSDGTYFTHEVSFQGFLAFVFGLLLGRRFRAVLSHVMENVKQIAEIEDKL
jgi:hypothetical protein